MNAPKSTKRPSDPRPAASSPADPRPADSHPAAIADGGTITACLARWVIVTVAWGALRLAKTPVLALPGPWQPRALVDRLASDGAFVGTVALAHSVLVLVGWYVAGLVTVGVVVRVGAAVLPRSAGAVSSLLRFVSQLPLPGARTVLAWSLGIAAFGSPMMASATSAASAASAAGGPPAPRMVAASDGASDGAGPPVMSLLPGPRQRNGPPRTSAPETRSRPKGAVPRELSPSSPATPDPPPTVRAPPPAAVPPPPAAVPAPADVAPTTTTPGTWVVRPGDHLWSISERTLASATGEPPPLDQLGDYWSRVVSANRPTLPDPANIDLLFPGDVVRLPPLPPLPPAVAPR